MTGGGHRIPQGCSWRGMRTRITQRAVEMSVAGGGQPSWNDRLRLDRLVARLDPPREPIRLSGIDGSDADAPVQQRQGLAQLLRRHPGQDNLQRDRRHWAECTTTSAPFLGFLQE